jgi:hypothetical protein
MDARTLARVQGAVNIVGGAWPLVHMPSFEVVFGPKADRWLARTVAGLLVANGITQVRTADQPGDAARWVGVGTSAVLAAVDFRYAPSGRISKMYLADGAVQVALIAGWAWLAARERQAG